MVVNKNIKTVEKYTFLGPKGLYTLRFTEKCRKKSGGGENENGIGKKG